MIEHRRGKASARYNLACTYALVGEADRSVHQLEQLQAAGDAGARWIEQARTDHDLDSVRSRPDVAAALE